MRAALLALLAALLAPAALAGCRTVDELADTESKDPRVLCRRSFAQCAPPLRYRQDIDVAALDVRKLVQLASRIDQGRLSAPAAKRLLELAEKGDGETLLEIESAIEDSDAVIGRCLCPEVQPEIDKRRIRDVVRARVVPREVRSPQAWTEKIAARLAELREIARRSATLAVVGAVAEVQQLEARTHEVERDLCVAVHDARVVLSPEVFEGMLQAVYVRREADAGAGSADSARRTVGAYARSPSCEAAPADEAP